MNRYFDPDDIVIRYRAMMVWPHETTPDGEQRGRHTFTASYEDSIDTLKYELAWLDAKDVVLGLGVRDQDITKTGLSIKKGSRHPTFPGVEVSFTSEVNLTPLARRGRELIAKHGSFKAAAKAVHPDAGGSTEDMAAISAANDARRAVFATDACALWQHNVRSVALGLKALRDVDRYGISKRGQQYAGFAGALTSG